MTQITDHLAQTLERVGLALSAAQRARDDAWVVAVSKQHGAGAIREAFDAGQTHFGESYVQEAIRKQEALADLPIVWHFIGRIQANKTRPIAERFDWVHTIDRERIASRLAAQRPPGCAPLNVLVQVNQVGEPQKAGVAEALAAPLAGAISTMPQLRLRGLMCMPPAGASDAQRAGHFRRLRALADELAAAGRRIDVLSMGMSGDFELAIANGSNCVRIGTAIFGPRARGV